jgi:hypothetical protein
MRRVHGHGSFKTARAHVHILSPARLIPPRVFTDPAAQEKPASHRMHAMAAREIPLLLTRNQTEDIVRAQSILKMVIMPNEKH